MRRVISLIISLLALITSYIFLSLYLDRGAFDSIKWFIFGAVALTNVVTIFVVMYVYGKKFRDQIRNLQNRLARWSKLSPRVNQIGDDAFQELPIGIIVLDDTLTEIKWVNHYAKVIFDNKLVDKPLKDINEALAEHVLSGSKNKMTIPVKEERYDVTYKSDYQVLYLFNVTEREKLKDDFIKHLPAIGIINLDNFEENISSFDISEQSSIKGEYLSAIADWVEAYHGYLKPYGDNRLFMLCKRNMLEEMIANKFEILERIREISAKHQIRVTMSMGIASWDLEYDELSDYAQNAIELAEKRGGDQVVVNIQHQKIAYFGAKLDASSKNSRVNARQYSGQIKDLLDKADQVFIMGHTSTDLDSFGSMIAALKMALTSPDAVGYLVIDEEKLDPTVTYVYKLLKQQNHPLLKHVVRTEVALTKLTKDTLILVLDTQNPLIVHSPELISTQSKLAVIDHHRGNEQSIQGVFSYVDPSASSTIELIMELVNFFTREISVDSFEASIMYAGLVVDTNTFTYRTNARTFEVAAKLKDFGADTVMVRTWLRNDLDMMIEMNSMLSDVEIYLDRFAIAVSDKIIHERSFLAQVSQQLLDIRDMDAAFTIVRLDENTIGVSARSYGNVNVQVIMEEMGGGGHLNSAATQIKDITVLDAYQQLKHILELQYGGDGEPMKVILIDDVKGKGKKDDVIEVANGYAQFLISSKLAVPANDENMKKLAAEKEKLRQQEIQHLNLMKKLASEIEGKSITLTLQVGADGKRFGSITTKQIVEEFEKKYGTVIDKKKLELQSDLSSAGIYSVIVNLDKQVKATFDVNIVEKRG